MAPSPTPDPTAGVFETMLVAAGRPVELEPHLERLRQSVGQLYGADLPASARTLAIEAAAALDLGRLRLTAVPRAAGVDLDTTGGAIDAAIVLPPPERGPELRSCPIEGWRGGHKWADRRLLEALEAEAAPRSPLLVDAETGAALETTRANIFVVRPDGSVATPPADGRILPGIARARAIDLAHAAGFEVVEAEIALADVASAGEAFLTGSLRGVEPVRSVDDVAIGDPEPSVAAAIADALRERWLGAATPG